MPHSAIVAYPAQYECDVVTRDGLRAVDVPVRVGFADKPVSTRRVSY